jgi:Uncharacterized conserved protein (DUF2190)
MDNKLILRYRAKTPTGIPRNRIVQFGAADGEVILATSVSTNCIGVTTEVAVDLDEQVDVVHTGVEWVEAGAAIPRGAFIGADATGRAINAGQTWGTIGRALETATAAGHRIRCLIQPGNI